MMKSIKFVACAAVLAASSPVCAQAETSSADPAGGVVFRLTPDQIAAIEDRKIDSAPLSALDASDVMITPQRKIHGEVGFGIGTGGYSEIFGTVIAPLGDTGYLALSLSQQNGRRFRNWR
ncbi:MAG: hypothetical protein ABL918_11110 [Chakrabartia sp.]